MGSKDVTFGDGGVLVVALLIVVGDSGECFCMIVLCGLAWSSLKGSFM
jgi:hypothetical protein